MSPGADPKRRHIRIADADVGHRTTAPFPSRRARRKLGDEIRDAILADYIASGAVRPGQRLPTEADFCEQYAVSRVTVRQALRSLQEAGLIAVRQGLGSTVLPHADAIASGLDVLCSFETFARDAGLVVDTADLGIEELDVDDSAAARLEVVSGTRALRVERAKLVGGVPVGWIVDYVPNDVLAAATLRNEFIGSVLDVLLAHEELGVEYSDCDVIPVNLDAHIAERLGVPQHTAALYLDEQTCTRDGQVVNWSQAWLLSEHLRFRVRRRRRRFASS